MHRALKVMLLTKHKKFFIIRLKNACLAELIYRFRELLIIWLLKTKLLKLNYKTPILLDQIPYNNLKLPSFQLKDIKDNISALLNDERHIFNSSASAMRAFENKSSNKFFSFSG